MLVAVLFLFFTDGSWFVKDAHAVELMTLEEALKNIFPDTQKIEKEVKQLTAEQKSIIAQKAKIKFDPILDREFHVYIGRTNGQIVGYAIEDTVKGKWGPMHYMLSLDPAGKIKNVIVLEYRERRGKPVAKRRFLKQFIGKSIHSRLKLKKDIQGVSGATISSRGMANGIRKAIYIFNELYAQNLHAMK